MRFQRPPRAPPTGVKIDATRKDYNRRRVIGLERLGVGRRFLRQDRCLSPDQCIPMPLLRMFVLIRIPNGAFGSVRSVRTDPPFLDRTRSRNLVHRKGSCHALGFLFTGPVHAGQGGDRRAGREMAALGLEGPVLIIAGKTVIGRLAETWKSSLDEAKLHHAVHRFGGECSLAEIERVKSSARECSARTIVGAGGGKVLDTARAAAADLGLPVVNCPTVASSDAPCSALSVIYTDEGIFQEYRFYRKNPDLVLVDTQVIAQAPPRLLSAGMGDALATWFEARTCVAGSVKNMRGGGSTASALALAELCYRTLLADGAAALARRLDPVGHPGARAAGRGEHLALGPGLRVVRPGRSPRRAQRPDRRARDPRLLPRREGRLRTAGPTGPRRGSARDRRGGAGLFLRGEPADHPGRHRPE